MKEVVRLYKEPHPAACVLFASWPGIGNVSVIAADYLRRKLDAEEIGEIEPTQFFEPTGIMVKDNVVEAPRFPQSKFYYWQDAVSGNGLLLFIGEEQPSSKGYELAQCILDVAERLKVQRVYSCAAAVARIHHTEELKVWGAATSSELTDSLESFDIVLKGDLHIAGLNGLFLGAARERGIEGICLLGEVPTYAVQIPNPKASLAVLEVLCRMLGIEVDLAELSESAAQSERQMDRLAKQAAADYIEHFTEPIWERGEDDEEQEE
jgi:uncharacterized protein (TIGR00162 family)